VTVSDDRCRPVSFVGGDTDGDGALDPGESWTYRCTTTLAATTVNTATVTGRDDDGNVVTDTATARVVVISPMIAIDKTASVATAQPGDPVTFTYTVTNPGDDALTAVVVSDNRCSPVAFQAGDADGDGALDPGETWTYTCTTTMPSTSGEVTNVGTVFGTDRLGGKVSADDTATVVVERTEVAGVTLARTGMAVLRYAVLAAGLFALGALLVAASRRVRPSSARRSR
jgi:hypothetical protein